jgi:hypothetical protein
MSSPLVHTAVPFKRLTFTIDQNLIDRMYVDVGQNIIPDSLVVRVGDDLSKIFDYQYQIIKVDVTNTNLYIGVDLNNYIIDWKLNYDINCNRFPPIVTLVNLGSNLEVTFVEGVDLFTSSSSDDTIDNINWEVTSGKFIIMINQSTGGTITPSGEIEVNEGDDLTIHITPDAGKRIVSVIIDGVNVGAVSSYTFTDISSSHSVFVSFDKELVWLEVIIS